MPLPVQPYLTSVIVVTANSGPVSVHCVEKVLASDAPLELTVVDNASSDGQIDAIDARFGADPRLRIVRNRNNAGFGPACNQAAALGNGHILLFLNPDCLLETDSIRRLGEVAREQPQAGIFGVRVTDPAGQPEKACRRREPTLRRSLNSLLGLARWEHRWPSLGGINMPAFPVGSEAECVEAVSGACVFVRRKIFENIGGFDSGYFLHCEDLDLCRRVRDAGFAVVFVDSITVVHAQGSSSHQRPLFVSSHKHAGMWRYFLKFDPAARNPLLRGLVWCGIWAHYGLTAPAKAWKQLRHRATSRDG